MYTYMLELCMLELYTNIMTFMLKPFDHLNKKVGKKALKNTRSFWSRRKSKG